MTADTAPTGGPQTRTGPAPGRDSAGRRPTERADEHHPIADARRLPSTLCPYLATESAQWRAAYPSRDHSCTAVVPPVALALDKQRRLCLVAAHDTCATFLAANLVRSAGLPAGVMGSRAEAGMGSAGGGLSRPGSRRRTNPPRRPVARTTPILMERLRPGLPIPESAARAGGQVLLVGLLVIAFAVIAVARFGVAGPAATPRAPASVVATPSPRPTTSPTPPPTLSPSPTPRTTPKPSASARATPVAYSTYTVRGGDTLLSIAQRYGVSASSLQKLNGIRNPSLLHPGQVLKIPR